MARLSALVLICASCAGIALLASEKKAEPARDPVELAALMRAKLASSQQVMEGLVIKDFSLIRKGGEELRQIADATQWSSYDDPVYGHYRAELKQQADKLVQFAKEKNLDAAAYTYIDSLTTCMSCHERCREVLHVVTEPPNLKPINPIPVIEDDDTAAEKPPVRR